MNKKYVVSLVALSAVFMLSGTIDLTSLLNYESQIVPVYINEDNTPNTNAITNEVATLGRVLFYDKQLSLNSTIACASCHQQEFGFGDTALVSVGLNGGTTGRHSMRLINARFSDEVRFFWDERANTLEDQTTQPIQDHIEMGFSGLTGQPAIDSLLTRLAEIDYYEPLFLQAFGDVQVTEQRISEALAQFVRSIQSFDSPYDIGLTQVNAPNQPFPNFTQAQNNGKALFLAPPNQGGAGCNVCHGVPEFDIVQNSQNNGVIGVAGDVNAVDLTNTRAPSLRDVVNANGVENGPFMHDGSLATLLDVINHYDNITFNPAINPALDNRLRPGGQGQNLNLSATEKNELIAFLGTLTGVAVYSDERWSNPFELDGSITLIEPNENVLINAKVYLEGPYDETSFSMSDDLRMNGYVPTIEPYTAMGYLPAGSGASSILDGNVLLATGADAIVDWVIVELRSAADNSSIVASRFALLQRDGDIVDVDGISAVEFDAIIGDYFVSVKHRNHLGVCTQNTLSLSTTSSSLDFTDLNTALHGTNATKVAGGQRVLWSGDVNFDGEIKYVGATNDRDIILVAVGGSSPTTTISGYFQGDTNMDGFVKYTGSANDRDPILVNIGGSSPTDVTVEQLP